MELAVRAARVGNAILSVLASVIILLMCLYGGYSLWDSYMINREAFLGSDLLKYKPTGDSEYHYSLEELMKLNPDTRGWLTIDDTHIDYPVVQGKTDMDYINTNVFGEFALSGSIFLSCMNRPDFSDSYSLIYGHHMDNGGMFGDVMKFIEPEYFAAHQTGTLYVIDKTYDVAIFACIEADAYDSLIYNPGSNEDTGKLLSYLQKESTQYRDIGVTPSDRIIGLSTCVDAETNGRVVLFGRITKRTITK